jgi:LmbE family N-acetylglucosaminyl deacetylase
LWRVAGGLDRSNSSEGTKLSAARACACSPGAADTGSNPLLVLSPHLDDALFACGETLARHPGALVVTVLAGSPAAYETATPWDRDAGFVDGEDVVSVRRAEDRAALEIVGARACWMKFLDRQYTRPGDEPGADVQRAIEQDIATLVDRCSPARVLVPLGLFHSDHLLVSDAALAVARSFPAIEWMAYEDALYRRLPGLVQERLHSLTTRGWQASPVELPGGQLARKRRAIACYASQLRALASSQRLGHADAFARERYWALTASEPVAATRARQ